jgi:regulatory protein YycI of two-component signal transduction system YycFG
MKINKEKLKEIIKEELKDIDLQEIATSGYSAQQSQAQPRKGRRVSQRVGQGTTGGDVRRTATARGADLASASGVTNAERAQNIEVSKALQNHSEQGNSLTGKVGRFADMLVQAIEDALGYSSVDDPGHSNPSSAVPGKAPRRTGTAVGIPGITKEAVSAAEKTQEEKGAKDSK